MSISKLTQISKFKKSLVLVTFDSITLIFTLFAAFSLRFDAWYWPDYETGLLILFAPIVAIPIFTAFGLYSLVNRHINFHAMWLIIKAVSVYALVWGVFVFLSGYGMVSVPRSVVLINWTLSILFIGGSRMFVFWLFSKKTSNLKNIIIYGAGSAGIQIHNALQSTHQIKVVAFIDDNKKIHGQYLYGIKVFGPKDIKYVVSEHNVSEVLLTIPSVSQLRKTKIINNLELYNSLTVRVLPGVDELAKGDATINDLRRVSVEDLLGRDSVQANQALLNVNIQNQVVMVTGAGGSIGSELCRQIIRLGVSKLILFEQSELALYNIDKELRNIVDIEIVPILGSVVNQNRIEKVCKSFGVKTIYHAAAYKHVPMVEFNNTEGVNNNVFGTLNCAKAAINCGVETFVLISTDKAVRPTNTMGATKRSAELVLQSLAAKQSSTKFTMVRFGNVLGSSGSVIPLFKQQIKEGGPVTVTDVNMVRYFMTIPEAVELVIQAGAMGQGGDVFVLDMGKPVKIYDLAKKMIHLTGLEVKDESNLEGDIEIQITGLRPGEKLYEELLIGDNVSDTDNPLIMRAQEEMLAWDELELILDGLSNAVNECDQDKLRKLLIQLVPGFKPQCKITDVLYR
jgi:FlaA1/EpsC-like NDP-sugar epimerase